MLNTENKNKLYIGIILVVFLIINIIFLKDYVIIDANVFLGTLLIAFVLWKQPSGKTNSRFYLIIGIALAAANVFIQIKTFFFLSAIFFLLYLYETLVKNAGFKVLFILLIISPIYKYFATAIGFPLRLQLSEIAGNILEIIGIKVSIEGNLIFIKDAQFMVDEACAGLKMLSSTLLITIFLISYYEKRARKTVQFYETLSLLFIAIIFNLLTNLLRIVFLVVFNIGAEHPMHYLMGISCLVLYTIIPIALIIKSWVIKFSSDYRPTIHSGQAELNFSPLSIIPISILATVGILNNFANTPGKTFNLQCELSGYAKSKYKDGILKFEKDDCLIYVKPINSFLGSEHNPMICWQGSGYHFKKISKIQIDNYEVYTGTLEKGDEKVYASWWFDNGVSKTTEQLSWRWKSMKGEGDFSLINVNCKNERELAEKTKDIIHKNIFN